MAYEINESSYALCPWILTRDERIIAQFTTEAKAEEYRDWLEWNEEDDDESA
jgi:hypothetical protein